MTVPRTQRRLAAILAADVVGYSQLTGADEDGTVSAMRAVWAEVFNPAVAAHRGRVFKTMGDGALCEFASAVDAVTCAVAVQAAMAGRKGTPEIIFRIGVNLGDIISEGDDIFGDGVNIAARLEALADPGGICISAKVHAEVLGKIESGFEDMGEQALKNIAAPVRVFRVSVRGALSQSVVQRSPTENALSIAVLPFDNMSGVPEYGYIGDGISENIITDLSRFRDISVLARNSSFAYKGKSTRVQDIRQDLGVNYILEGSVQRAGDRIRVTAQLINAADGRHLWAERYDRRVDDLFAVMDEITQLIVGTLGATYGGRLRKSASEDVSTGNPTSFPAFDCFVLGMQDLNLFTEKSLESSITLFEQAVKLNPRYAKAHAKLAWAHLMILAFGWAGNETDTLKKAKAAANCAVSADEAEAWAHWAVAGCAMFELKHDRALESMRRAIELNPNDADVLTDMGAFCSYSGRSQEGLQYALTAIKLNPHHPEYYLDQLGQIYFDARQYENAIRTFEGIRSLTTPSMLVYLAASHAALGNKDSARLHVDALLDREPQSTASYCASLIPYHEDGDREHMAANLRLAGLPE